MTTEKPKLEGGKQKKRRKGGRALRSRVEERIKKNMRRNVAVLL